MPIQIADAFLFPIINIATRSNPKAAETAIHQLSKYFSDHQWNGEGDVPSLSDKLITLLSNTYTRKEISTEVRIETAKIWLEMFNRKGKLDDIILFLDAWLSTGSTINIDLSNIIQNVKNEIVQPSFINEISSRQFRPFYSNTLISKQTNQPQGQTNNTHSSAATNAGNASVPNPMPLSASFTALSSISNNPSNSLSSSNLASSSNNNANNNINSNTKTYVKRCAAIHGFLYVFDERFGLVKLGTGLMGTVYSSLEVHNKKYEGYKPVGLALTPNFLILRYENGPLTVCDPITLEQKFYILENGEFSETLRAVDRKEDALHLNGSFTSIGDTLLFHEERTIYQYSVAEGCLVFQREINLANINRMNYDSTMITNGSTILMTSQSDDRVELFEFNLSDGSFIQSKRSPKILSNNLAFDFIAKSLFCISDIETPVMMVCSQSISGPTIFPQTEDEKQSASAENQENEDERSHQLMELFQTFPLLMISRLDVNQQSSKYQIQNITIMYKVLETCSKTENGKDFINPIVKLLYIYLINHPKAPLPSPELVKRIWEYIDVEIRPYLICSLFNTIREPYNSQKILHDMISSFSAYSVIKGVGMIQKVDPELLVVLLEKEDILKEATKSLTHMKYTFLQKLITTITHGFFGKKCVPAGMIIPIFISLVPSKSHLFLSLMASMLPVLKSALSEPLVFGAILPILPSFIREMHAFVPVKALEDFARHHIAVCTDQPFRTRVIIDETPHPYQNNSDYVHTFDFSNAIEVMIVFDPLTHTEANCDWLQVFADRECNRPLSEKMSGRFNRWKSPIMTHAKVISLKFHSDTSVNEWGYRATITQKIFSQQNYDSPDPRFDVYYSFYNIIIDNMKTFKSFDNSQFEMESFDPSDFDFDEDIRPKVRKLLNITDDNFEQIGPLFGLKIALINHLYKVYERSNVNFDRDILLHSILCPFAAINFNPSGYARMANQMLFYIPPGISKENRNFLSQSIRGSSQSQSFITDSLKFANDVFDAEEPPLTDCATAANKAVLAFKLMDQRSKEETMRLWFKCLCAISRIKTSPGSLTQSSFKALAKLGMYIDVDDDFADEFARMHCDVLKNTSINTSDMDAPVVSFVLNRISKLKPGTVANSTLLDIIMRSLEFNLPNVTNKVSELIDYFSIKCDTITPQFERIIAKVGECFKDIDVKSVTSVIFDTGKTFSFSLAECLRKLLTNNSLNMLTKTLYTNHSLGVLILFSARSFPLIPGHKVMLKNYNNLHATVTSIDPLKISLLTDTNTQVSIPLIDFRSLTPINLEIERILPPMLVGADQALINAVLVHKNSYIALAALSELLPYAKCNFSDLFNQIKSVNTMYENEEPKFTIYEEMTKLINAYPENEGIKSKLPGNIHVNAYIYTEPISVYYFEPDGDALFGFCEKGNPLPNAAFLLTLTEKSILFDNTPIIEHETIRRVKFGYLNETMIVYIHTESTLKTTDIFLPPLNNPIPCIITRGKIKTFDPKPLLTNPLFDISFQMKEHIPTHVYISNELVSIDSLYEDNHVNKNEPVQIQLFPALSRTIDRFYIEFSFNSTAPPTICLSSPLQQTILMYTYTLKQKAEDGEIAGLLIDNKKHFTCVTIDGEVVKDSIKRIEDEDSLIVFSLKNVSSFTLNKGAMPFLFDETTEIDDSLIGGIVYNKPEHIPMCPLQPPTTYKPSQVQNFATGMMTPYIVCPNEKGGPLSGKVGFGMCDDQKVTVFITGDLSRTITPVTTLYSNVSGVIERISNSYPSFQMNLLNYIRSYRNLPVNEGSLDENNCEMYKWAVLTICLSKAAIDMNEDEEVRFIINTITNVSFKTGDTSMFMKPDCFSKILNTVFTKEAVLRKLCTEAMRPLLIDQEYFKSYSLYTLCPNKGEASTISLHGAENILFVTKGCILKEQRRLTDNYGNGVTLTNGCHAIFVFQGDTIHFDALKGDDIINAHIVPLCQSSNLLSNKDNTHGNSNNTTSNGANSQRAKKGQSQSALSKYNSTEFNFKFALNFILCFINYIKQHTDDKRSIEIFDEVVLFPLWKHIMTTEARIFTNSIANWLSTLYDPRIFSEQMLKKYRKTLNLSAVINDQPSFFTALLCLISMYLYKGTSLQNFIEYVLDIDKNKQTFASLVFRQFSVELLNPFLRVSENPLRNLTPGILSSVVVDALALSRRENCILVKSNTNEASKITNIHIQGADKLAIMRILLTPTASVSLNQLPIVPDCVVDGTGGSLKITKGLQNQVPYVLQIIPIYKRPQQHAEDARKIVLMLAEIQEKWTPEYEAFARHFAQIAFSIKFPYLFSGVPDKMFSLIFPTVAPEVARFRCALCFMYLKGTEECTTLNFSSNLHECLKGLFLSFIPQRQLVCTPKHGRMFLPSSLPTRNASMSDFFAQLYREFENVPVTDILSLSDEIVGNSSEPTKVTEVIANLENDMFVDGEPNSEATSQTQMSGFLGFGMFGAVCFAAGRLLPVDVSEGVVRAITGGRTEAEGSPQLTAIRLGAQKVEFHYSKLKIAQEGPYYMKYFELAASHSESALEEASYGANLIANPLFGPYIQKLTKGKPIKSCTKVREFVFDYDQTTGKLTVPEEDTLLQIFQ